MYRQILLALAFVVPSVAVAQSVLLAGWDFQTTTNGGTAIPETSVPLVFEANFGTQAGEAAIYLDGANGSSLWTTTEYAAGSGSALNAASGFSTETANPAALSLKNNSANGQSISIKLSLLGYANLNLSYALIGTSSGFDEGQWYWSADGNEFESWGPTIVPTTSFATITLSTLTEANNVNSVYLRYTVTGATHSSGNNRLDNIQLTATAIPEPSTYAAIFGGIVLISAVIRRRRPSVR